VPGSLVGDESSTPGSTVNTPRSTDLQAGFRISLASVAWSVTACAAAVVKGSLDDSLVLIAFGLTGLLDGAGSMTLALHFRHALAHNAVSPSRERFALRVVSIGLIVIGLSTTGESARRIVAMQAGHGSPLGIAIAGTSAVVLAVLATLKRRVARALPSDALAADGWLSAAGAALGLVAVAGTALAALSAPPWVDPVCAMGVAGVAAAIGFLELRREARAL
jgi:divalent metal cation (Fe/Co/Zn/Cd) transporter